MAKVAGRLSALVMVGVMPALSAGVAWAAEPEPGPRASTDQLVDKVCGSNPLERKIAARLERANLGERELVAFKDCKDWGFKGELDAPLPLKALKLLDVKAEAAFRRCLAQEKIRDPQIIETLTGYVRSAFAGNDADQRMQREYAACYENVLRCHQHPCRTMAERTDRTPRREAAALRLAVRLLTARAGDPAEKFAPLAADSPLRTGDKVVFQVTPSRRVYVYIVQRAARGRLHVLFPDPDIAASNPLNASTLRLPTTTSFVLDREVGHEKVFVVASLHEQTDLEARIEGARRGAGRSRSGADDGERELGRALDEVSDKRGGAAPGAAATVTPDGDAVTRGLVLSSRMPAATDAPAPADGPVVSAQAAPGDDTVVIQVGFDHLAGAAR